MSAHSIAAVLNAQAFNVISRFDPSAGQLNSAIDALNAAASASPNAPVVVYVCGYAAGLNDRAFVLPISAAPQRASDVLSQGILAKTFINAVGASDGRAALFIYDVVPTPGLSEPIGLASLQNLDLPSGVGVLGVTEAAADGPTPLVGVIVPRLKVNPVTVSALIEAAGKDLSGLRTTTLEARKMPAMMAYLVGAPPPPPPPPPVIAPAPRVEPVSPPLPAVAMVPAAPAPVTTAPVTTAPVTTAPVTTGPVPNVPDENHMTDADRRTVQTALTKVGYYDGRIDGIFGSETRAAIRRYQHEVNAPMTGIITPEQSRALLSRQ